MMISQSKAKSVPWDGVFVVIFQKTMYNKTIIRFGFCDILNNQGLDKCYQPRPSARLVTLTSTLFIPDVAKTSSSNCYNASLTPFILKWWDTPRRISLSPLDLQFVGIQPFNNVRKIFLGLINVSVKKQHPFFILLK